MDEDTPATPDERLSLALATIDDGAAKGTASL